MRTRLRHLWEVVSSGYWFVPAVMMAAAVAAAFLLLRFDRTVIDARHRIDWLYTGGSEGAKTLLSTVAASVITVAGVVFSITIAALTQASGQFGPRLLRQFMRDTGNQTVLGTFVATYVYCLLVLRTIHGDVGDGRAFVPQASVTFAVLMAGASIAVLVYFIHHVSTSLQAPAVVAAVKTELEHVIERLPGDQNGSGVATVASTENRLPSDFEGTCRAVCSTREGYVQAVDYDGLIDAAREAGAVLRLAYRAGDYVISGSTLLWVWPAERCSSELESRLNRAYICGRRGTPEQDVEYAFRQIVEVAVRALSPGINDPFTAVNCVDALASSLCQVARRGLPGPLRYDADGQLRVVTPVTTFAGLTDTALNQIRQHGRTSVAVTVRLLEVIQRCAEQMTTREQRQALLRHANMIYRQSQEAIPGREDRDDVRRCWEAAVAALGCDGFEVAADRGTVPASATDPAELLEGAARPNDGSAKTD